MSAYPKFVCPECDVELHCLVNPVTCANCGGTLLIEDDEPDEDMSIPLGLYYWSQQQKESRVQAEVSLGIRKFEELLAEVGHGSQDEEEDLS